MTAKKPAPKTTRKVATQPPFNLATIFPTNVLSRDWEGREELNHDLKASIWRDRANDPDGLYRSNLAGTWHSQDGIFDRLDGGTMLRDMFGNAFSEWGGVHGLKDETVSLRMSAWAMVYSDRGYATVHTHPNCHVSGVYYVDDTSAVKKQTMATGVAVRSGDIEFLDTRRGGEHQLPFMNLNPSAVMSFKAGRMIVFPSALPHFVHPIVGPGERIAIACNCSFIPSK